MKVITSNWCLIVLLAAVAPHANGREIYKCKDEKGQTILSQTPCSADGEQSTVKVFVPPERSSESKALAVGNAVSNPTIDQSFLLGRWRSEEFVANETRIPSQIYIFTATAQGVEGKSMTMPIRQYVIEGNLIKVVGGIVQEYTVLDSNTVSYAIPGGKTAKLHRVR